MPDRPVPPPDCPTHLRITEHVPMAHVADVDRSNLFYALLGFACDSRFSDQRGTTNWCALTSGKARLFLARASEPVVASRQAVLFYMYSRDVRALRAHLIARGITDAGPITWDECGGEPVLTAPAVFDIVPRFYMPAGELRVHDPDGYVILVGQLG
jgi:hypothetical protein